MLSTHINKEHSPAAEELGRVKLPPDQHSERAQNPMWRSLALGSVKIQRKLKVSQPGDPQEQEADRVADQVTSAPGPLVQRACDCGGACSTCSEDRPNVIQAKHAQSGEAKETPVPPVVDEVLHSAGEPLDSSTRAFMESGFEHDFGDVRLHTSGKAAESAQAINSLAYTVGSDIVLGAGAPGPQSNAGRKLLAHELTHVVQQSSSSGAHELQRWSLSNCNKAQEVYIEDAITKSHADLTKAKGILDPSPASAFVKNALWLAFRDDSDATVTKLRTSIGELQKNITSTHIICQASTHKDCGTDVGYHQDGQIYLCMPTFTDKLNHVDQANTVTHEAAHKYLNVRDTGYFAKGCEETASRAGPEKQSGTAGDNPVDRFNNADAYSCFVHFLVRRTAPSVEASANEYKGGTLKMEAKEKTIYTITATPSRDDGAFRILDAPSNSGFRYRWKLSNAAGEEFPLAAMNSSKANPSVFNDDVPTIYVPTESRQLLAAKKVTKATIQCEIQVFKPATGTYVPDTKVFKVEVDVHDRQDPFDTSKL